MSERSLLSPYPNSPWTDECYHAPDERCEHCAHVTDEELFAYYGYDNCNALGICVRLVDEEYDNRILNRMRIEHIRVNDG